MKPRASMSRDTVLNHPLRKAPVASSWYPLEKGGRGLVDDSPDRSSNSQPPP